MAARLIVNADDFGLTHGINRAVAELHEAGALTSATLMASGPAFDDAVAIAHAHPSLGVGCHVVLTDGMPVCHAETIPSLMGADGKTFRSSLLEFIAATLAGHINPDDVIREGLAQVQRLQRAGIDVTHLDTHKHTHMLPAIAQPLLYVAERAGIGAIRSPFEQSWSSGAGRPEPIRRLEVLLCDKLLAPRFRSLPQIRHNAVQTTDGTLGISATGRLNRDTLAALLQRLPEDGIFELVCHPGYNDRDLDAVRTRLRVSREIERQALLDCIPSLGPQLTHYGNLGNLGLLRELGQHQPATGHERLT
ncbi:Predicted glycoside hydrolase or deacetylase ChbG, UPF0249 family [Bryocella elongata]|uniref:Predicted glycoside hydrolase or deacetylase ChbG, UPF0249 family n=1 Tax=Bryocella elongata TaxID=863522 RepID=A0A1H5UH79_9BACT|nr:ChbG/HpnK family deacetylase [Bryocella elongata]SEF73741.1 Predicted glycoside hydrolase or deacetylase ChbG, UPF0249 family [Bryocella elongata]